VRETGDNVVAETVSFFVGRVALAKEWGVVLATGCRLTNLVSQVRVIQRDECHIVAGDEVVALVPLAHPSFCVRKITS